ncbi:MAG: hypothetical protein R2726_01565 [Acidimicrobiales bacterium]
MSPDDSKGVKPPRTLFSLGRPGAKERGGAAVVDESRVEALDTDTGDDEEIQYACGACGALLPTGAAFCGECGTPVATDEYFEDELLADDGAAPGGLLDEAFTADEAAEPVTDAAAPAAGEHDGIGAVAATAAGAGLAGAAGAAALSHAGHDAPADELLEEAAVGEEPAAGAGDVAAPTEVAEEPAAVLYRDQSLVEPLPPPAESGFHVAEPVVGAGAGLAAGAAGDEALAQFVGADETAVVPGPVDDTVVAPAPPDEAPAGADEPTTVGPAVAGAGMAGAGMAAAGVIGAEHAGAAETASPLSELSTPPPPAVPTDGATAQDMPYGEGPLETSPKSKTPLILAGVGALLVIAGIIGVLLAMGGSKNENVATAPSSTSAPTTAKATSTTAAPSSTTSTESSTTTTEATTSTTAVETTTTTAAPVTTQATTAPTASPGTPGQPGTPGLPSSVVSIPAVVQPGKIQPSPAGGATLNLQKGQPFSVVLRNSGGSPASYTLRGNGLGANGGGTGSVPPNGGTVTVNFTATQAEGFKQGAVAGSLEGFGTYIINTNILNG